MTEFQQAPGAVPVAANVTEVLTGVEPADFVTPDTLAALWDYGGTITTAAAISLPRGGYFILNGAGTVNTITFAEPTSGRTARIFMNTAGIILKDSFGGTGSMDLPGGDITTAVGDWLEITLSSPTYMPCRYFRATGKAVIPPIAIEVPFTPSGTISSTTVAGALQELEIEKAPKASPVFTGNGSIAGQFDVGGNMFAVGNVISTGGITGVDRTGDAATALIYINGDAGQLRATYHYTAGAIRWLTGASADAEGGANAGSNYAIYRYSDASAYLGMPFFIARATGIATFEVAPSFPTQVVNSNNTFGATTAFVLGQAATAAEQEAAASATKFVTPAVQQRHPSAANVWAFVTYGGGIPGISAAYNVSAIIDTAVGRLTINFDIDFTSVNYACLASLYVTTGTARFVTVSAMATTGVTVDTNNTSAALADGHTMIAAFGDQ